MNQTSVRPHSESLLRRWWRGFNDTLQAMESSGYEDLIDHVVALEMRIRKLEAKANIQDEHTDPALPAKVTP